jgi:hypothetical protein
MSGVGGRWLPLLKPPAHRPTPPNRRPWAHPVAAAASPATGTPSRQPRASHQAAPGARSEATQGEQRLGATNECCMLWEARGALPENCKEGERQRGCVERGCIRGFMNPDAAPA